MKKVLYFYVSVILLLCLSSCKKNSVKGEGDITTVERQTASFDKVLMEGSTNVFIIYGAELNVKVKGYSNLLPVFETKVSNNTLKVGYKNDYNIRNDNVEVYITMPSLAGLKLSGSGDAAVTGNFTATPSLELGISGSGKITYNSPGLVDQTRIAISGSGNVMMFPVSSKNADITISGSGETSLTVEQSLKARISGSGSVFYKGQPQVDSEISGSGKVVHVN